MLPLNKLALQLELIDEENTWTTQPGANQDYVIVTTPLMSIQVVRDTENTYDIALTPDPLIDRMWDRPKKTKLLIKVTARTLVSLADSILKRLVNPHKAALERARDVYIKDEIAARLANEGLKPFIQRHKIDEEDIVWAGVGNHVASFFTENPETAVHVISQADGTHKGQIKVSQLSLAELEEMVKAVRTLGVNRWMRDTHSTTPSDQEESSSLDTESDQEDQMMRESTLVDDLPSSTS